MAFAPAEAPLRRLYRELLASHGPQHWWPGESRFEILVGAVLTQNTAWANVEKAIAALGDSGLLDAGAMLAAGPAMVAPAIRPARYFNVKAARLDALCRAIAGAGGLEGLDPWPTGRLRAFLLDVKGVGPETADDMLLYAFDRPVFVIDAYTRRLLARLGLASGDEPYEVLRAGMESALGPDAALYGEFHALIVAHGKAVCRPAPRCGACRLAARCPRAGVPG